MATRSSSSVASSDHRDGPARCVLEGVVEEHPGDLLEGGPVGDRDHAGRPVVDVERPVRAERCPDPTDDRLGRDRLGFDPQGARFESGQGQQLADQAGQPVGLGPDDARALARVRVRAVGRGQLVGHHHDVGQRRLEVVADPAQEVALEPGQPIQSIDPIERPGMDGGIVDRRPKQSGEDVEQRLVGLGPIATDGQPAGQARSARTLRRIVGLRAEQRRDHPPDRLGPVRVGAVADRRRPVCAGEHRPIGCLETDVGQGRRSARPRPRPGPGSGRRPGPASAGTRPGSPRAGCGRAGRASRPSGRWWPPVGRSHRARRPGAGPDGRRRRSRSGRRRSRPGSAATAARGGSPGSPRPAPPGRDRRPAAG